MNVAGAVLILVSLFGTTSVQHSRHGSPSQPSAPASSAVPRQAIVAERGAQVMPFDLNRSTHVFATELSGGTQTVMSDDGDAGQVALIRQHLQAEANAFARGEYASPTRVHGGDMPGVADLSRSARHMSVTYEAIDRGARIRYTSARPEVVAAIHRWFAAQLSDRGAHAHDGSAH